MGGERKLMFAAIWTFGSWVSERKWMFAGTIRWVYLVW
jgi:hypothetical protein